VRSALLAGVALTVVLAAPATTIATFPGRNGPIAFVSQKDECFFPEYDKCYALAPHVLELRLGHRGTRHLAVGFEPRYSRDGHRLAVDRCYCDDSVQASDTIFTKRLDAATPAQPLLPQGPRFRNIDPAWSPNGHRLVFARSRGSFPRDAFVRNELWSMTDDGGELRPLGPGGSPDWSSTGRIAFTVPVPGRGEMIKTMKPDGSDVRTLTRGSNPSWSPSGRLIVFDRQYPRDRAGVHVIGADATGLRRLTQHTGDAEAVWSPNGEKIAYLRRRTYTSRLVIMRADGSAPRILARHRDPYILATPDWATRTGAR
jgi:Tol biopolymer transport system component